MTANLLLVGLITAGSVTTAANGLEGVDAKPVPARAPVHRAGGIVAEDYPASALRARAEGLAAVRLQVGADGRVTGCTVERSAGSSALDSATCALAQRRFRYSPATDSAGRPMAGTSRFEMVWRLPDENPDSSGKTPASD